MLDTRLLSLSCVFSSLLTRQANVRRQAGLSTLRRTPQPYDCSASTGRVP
jgi:hypothetical protein